MSRFIKRRKKKNWSQIILLLIISLFLLAITIFIGLKLILSATSLMVSLDEKNKQSTKPNENIIRDINVTIEDIPKATNSARIMVKGSMDNIDSLSFYVNKIKVKEIYPKATNFSEAIGPLNSGKNEIEISGKNNKLDKSVKSKIYSVDYNKEGPKIIILSPEDNTTVSSQEIEIKGKVKNNVDILKINEMPVVLTQNGEFAKTVKLQKGENKIKITANDLAGNKDKQQIIINYSPD